MEAGTLNKTATKEGRDKLQHLMRKIESTTQMRRDWERQWKANQAIYMGDHQNALEFTGSYFYATMNLTAQVVNTKSAYLNSTPVRPVVVPSDNNEPVEWYLTKKGMQKAATGEAQGAGLPLTPEQLQGAEPMDEEMVKSLREMGFVDHDLSKVDDDTVADALTQELAYEWRNDTADQWLSCNNSDKIVIGHSDAICQWDAFRNAIHFETLYPYDVYVDPVADSFGRANWVAVKEILTKAEARERWPKLKDEINRISLSDDLLTQPQGGRYRNMDGEEYVVHWTMWERHAEFDMDEEQANAEGHVVPHPETGEPAVMKDGKPEKLEEDGSNWPQKTGTRQLELLGDIVIYDGETVFGDIPVDRNYNIRAVASAYGIGDPQSLQDLQDIINRVLSQFAENIAQFRSPMLATPESVFSALESELKRAFSIAGMKLPVPDSAWEANNGNIIKEIAPPQIPQSAVQLFEVIINQFFRMAGVPAALRGDTQSGTSGRAMEISTSNASEPIAQVARNTEMFLRKLLHTAVYMIVEYLPTEEFCKRNKRFEPHVFDAIRRRVRRIGYEIDVQVSGTNRQDQEAQRLISAAHNVPVLWQSPTFTETLLKKLGLPDATQIAEEVQAAQMAQMQAQAPQPQQAAQGGLQGASTPAMMNRTGPRPGMNEAR